MANQILIDLTPLRDSRGFRMLFAGQLAGMFGSQLMMVAIPFQVYALTRSSLQVGAVSLAQLIPLVAGALFGGSAGDAVDRRLILAGASSALALAGGALAAGAAFARPPVAGIYLIGAAAAGAGGAFSTVCNAAVPSLAGRRHLLAAYASMQVTDQVGMVAAPALGGLLIAAVHLQWVYALAAGSYVLTALTVSRMPAIPVVPGARRPGLGTIADGLRYLKGRQPLQGAYLIDLSATVFGLPRALFPALAATVFGGGARTLGYLYAAPAAGALLGSLLTGRLDRIRRQGRAVIAAVGVWGAAIVAFGLVHVLPVALGLLAVAGWADVISAVLRTTIVQQSAADEFRSRVSSVQIAIVEGGPRLGDLESGVVASVTSAGFSIVSGGLACIAGAALLSGLLPGFRRYRRPAS